MTVYAHINTVPHGSTGGIMMKEHRDLLEAGEESYAFWGRGRGPENDHEMKISTDCEVALDVAMTRIDGRSGFHSKNATIRLLRKLSEIKPDVVHLHNLHGYYINIELLFGWLSKQSCLIEWTLHDCWSFTGHCTHFQIAACDQWKSACAAECNCPQLKEYPMTYARSGSCKWCYMKKRHLISSIPKGRLRLIVPSRWMAELIPFSYLSDCQVEVRHNTIDGEIFKRRDSDFRSQFNVGNKYLILGVASPWTVKKGIDDFYALSKKLDSTRFAIVMVGLNESQLRSLPRGIIGLPRVSSAQDLACIYSAADVLFNPTLEDTYPTVNLESQSCGTPVITYNSGGCAETLSNDKSRVVANLEEAIEIFEKRAFNEGKLFF